MVNTMILPEHELRSAAMELTLLRHIESKDKAADFAYKLLKRIFTRIEAKPVKIPDNYVDVEELLTIEQTAVVLGRNRPYVANLAYFNHVDTVKIGSIIYIKDNAKLKQYENNYERITGINKGKQK